MKTKISTLLIGASFFMCSRTCAMKELEQLLSEIEPPIASQNMLSRQVILEVDQSLRNGSVALQKFHEKRLFQKLAHLESFATPFETTSIRMMHVSTGVTIAAAAIITIKTAQVAKRNNIPDRFPPALLLAAPALGFLKTQGVNIAAGVSAIYLVNKAAHAVNTMIHAPCKAREKEIVEEFKKTVADATAALGIQFTDLEKEVLRQTKQARMNSVDALIKSGDIAQGLTTRLEMLEKKLAKSDLKKELEPFKKELVEQRKKLDQLRKQKDPEMATLRKELDRIQQNLNVAAKSGDSRNSNNAIAILALQLQRVSEDLKRHESDTPASTPASTPRAGSSTSFPRDLTLAIPSAQGRRASIAGLSPITEHVTPPSESNASGSSAGNPTITLKPPSPQRRHSFCGNLFGHKDKGK